MRRVLALNHLRDWCMDRLSMLSLDGRMEDARAVTAEHLELLEAVDARRSLWVTIERCAANWPGTTRSSCFFPQGWVGKEESPRILRWVEAAPQDGREHAFGICRDQKAT